jgi:hypothetical protein
MTVFTEGRHRGEYRIEGGPGDINVEVGTVGASTTIVAGQICKGPLTGVTAAAATDTASLMIAYENVTTGAGETKKITFDVRGPMTVNGNDLTFASGITAPQKTAQINALAALGIVVRL